MAQFYSTEMSPLGGVPPRNPGDPALNTSIRIFRATIPLDAPPTSDTANGTVIASGDTIALFDVPPGARFLGGKITSNVSLGTSTISIGNASSAAKYRAAAVHTAVDTPTPFGTAASMALGEAKTTERVIATVGTANLPNTAGAKLVIDMEFSWP